MKIQYVYVLMNSVDGISVVCKTKDGCEDYLSKVGDDFKAEFSIEEHELFN